MGGKGNRKILPAIDIQDKMDTGPGFQVYLILAVKTLTLRERDCVRQSPHDRHRRGAVE